MVHHRLYKPEDQINPREKFFFYTQRYDLIGQWIVYPAAFLLPHKIYYLHQCVHLDPHCRDHHPHLKQKSQKQIDYADDVDFIGQNYSDIKKIQEVLLKKIPVNTDKTDYTSMSKSEEEWKEVKNRITYR